VLQKFRIKYIFEGKSSKEQFSLLELFKNRMEFELKIREALEVEFQ
jgi:hypothetical protein